MGLRERLNRNPKVGTALGIAVVALGGVACFVSLRPWHPAGLSDKAFYTVDEGKTFFVDDAVRQVPPILHEGREAVWAKRYSCDHGRNCFVAYLVKFTPEYKKAYEAEAKRHFEGDPPPAQPAEPGKVPGGGMPGKAGGGSSVMPPYVPQATMLVKRPGDAQWVSRTSHEGIRIITVQAPAGGAGDQLDVVDP